MKAAAINDLSGFGKCSLIADISVLTAMGIQVCPVPTAVFTAQTGFLSYYCSDMTYAIPHFTEEWSKKGETFDGILTGFLMNERQADDVIRFVSRFHTEHTILLVDPVMADNGEGYANFSQPLLDKMRMLAAEADILTPNISELCLLAGVDMGEVLGLAGDKLFTAIEKLACGMITYKERHKEKTIPKTIIITGVPITADQADPSASGMGNLIVNRSGAELLPTQSAEGAFSGTGDLFAAVVMGGLLNGRSVHESVDLAADFIYRAAVDAFQCQIDKNEGTEYEKYLYMLERKE